MSFAIKQFVENNLTIIYETINEYGTYCPFHKNTDTPAFSINKHTGLWNCFNPSCGKAGNFATLSKLLTGHKVIIEPPDYDILFSSLLEQEEQSDWSEILEKITIDYASSDVSKLQYLLDRGFSLPILSHFEVCFSESKNRIVIPCRDENFKVVGFIGRATREDQKPKYLYSEKMPRGGILFNLQNAKIYSKVIVAEGSLDVIRIHQAGFPNVVATLGSTVTEKQIDLLNYYFNEIVIFSDNDEAGRAMRRGIINRCPRKTLYVVIYPEGIKDPGEMPENLIQITIENKISYLDYLFKENDDSI